jgi:mannosyltransferase OCH1-like enzyme
MPEYEFKEWNEITSPTHPYLSKALELKKWANASNWVRLYALNKFGGVYLDTDVEVLLPLDPFLNGEAFVGFEVRHFDWDGCVNNAVFGSTRDHWFVRTMLDRISRDFDGTEEAHFSSPHLTTNVLQEFGLEGYRRQNINGVEVYPVETFYPYGWHEIFNPDCVQLETHTIHWYSQSWLVKENKIPWRRRAKAAYNLIRWHLWAKKRFY